MFYPSALAIALVLVQSAHQSISLEQREFSAMAENVKRPVTLPPSVIRLLKDDRDVKHVMESLGLPSDQLPLSWFLASEVHLSERNEKDLVVVGTILGANVTTFWIFRPEHGGFELPLDGAPALQLNIKNTRSHGYRDVELVAATAVTVSTVVCKFDGRIYKTYSSSTKPIN